MFDAIVISDLHLGSLVSRVHLISHFLSQLISTYPTQKLLIAGDLFQSLDFRRLNKYHWHILSQLRKLSKKIEVIWLVGNHDGSSEIISHLLGLEVKDEYILTSNQHRTLILHGHIFDSFIERHPFISWLADLFYSFLQHFDSQHNLARWAKHKSKVFLRCKEKIKTGAIRRAKQLNCQSVVCGHTHYPETYVDLNTNITYINSGSWTELPPHFVTILNGNLSLIPYESNNQNTAS